MENNSKLTPPKPESDLFVFLKETLKICTFSLATPFIETLATTNYFKRLDAFLKDVVTRIQGLSEKIDEYKYENLIKNEEFIAVFVRVVEVARRNHKEEKREFLKNAIINSVSYKSSTDLKELFIRYIDELNVDQLILLKNIAHNEQIIGVPNSYKEFYDRYNEDITKTPYSTEVLTLFLNDLKSKGLIHIHPQYQNENYPSPQINVQSGPKKPNLFVSDLAKEFLSFIINELRTDI